MPEWVTPVAIVLGLLTVGAISAYWPMSLRVEALNEDVADAKKERDNARVYLDAYQSNQEAAVFLERDISDSLARGVGDPHAQLEGLLDARAKLHRRFGEPLPPARKDPTPPT